jgi:mannosyltransferase OCH1-like enzyme
MEFYNKDIISDKTLNPGLRADALRLELLYQYGGVYIDVDVICL